MTTTLEALVHAANSELPFPHQTRVIGDSRSEESRFELYHSGRSICSQKVRSLLAEKRVPYVSHDLNLVPTENGPPDNFRPGYIRLRLRGLADGVPLARRGTGRSSVSTEGVDPCVVPTLVDHEKDLVVVDSLAICRYIDQQGGADRPLVPESRENEVSEQLDLVDQAPHVAVLYGCHPDADARPKQLAQAVRGIHARKIALLEELRTEALGEPALVTAYATKIEKETAAGAFVADANAVRGAHTAMAQHVLALERALASHGEAWVLGARYSLADIFWTVSIFRLGWLGLGDLWQTEGRAPHVRDYVSRAVERPSFVHAVLEWPVADTR